LIYQGLRTGSGDNEIKGGSNLAIFSIKMYIFWKTEYRIQRTEDR
jgi:hypothetical protein